MTWMALAPCLLAARYAARSRRRMSYIGAGSFYSTGSTVGAIDAPHRVLFFGTDEVSVATLRKLYENTQHAESTATRVVHDIHVVCPSDRKVGRSKRTDPVPVKRFALDHGLPFTCTPPKLKSLKRWHPEIIQSSFDVGVVVSFGYFLHPHLLTNLHYGAINMHPSLLPQFRGPAPIPYALWRGETTTGVSVLEIDPKAFDVGRILKQEQYAIPRDITSAVLAQELAALGADCVLETLRDLPVYKRDAIVQNETNASHAPKITLEDGVLTLNESADEIYQRWQALSDSVGVRVHYKSKSVKFSFIRRPDHEELQRLRDDEQRIAPGSFFFDKSLNALWLKCIESSSSSSPWLLINKLQQADRKVGEAIDFANGYRLKRSHIQSFTAIPIRSN